MAEDDKAKSKPLPAADGQDQPSPDAAPLAAPRREMADVSRPDPAAFAAGLQSENGSDTHGFFDSAHPDAKPVKMSSAFNDGKATTNVYERYTAPHTDTPQHRLIARKDAEVPEARVTALRAAEKNLK